MGFDFSAMGAAFSNPLVIGFLVIIFSILLLGFGYFIVKNVRGGFGRLTRPKDQFQR
ncbi:unnamed protein product, partial [marine sediment metagenome]